MGSLKRIWKKISNIMNDISFVALESLTLKDLSDISTINNDLDGEDHGNKLQSLDAIHGQGKDFRCFQCDYATTLRGILKRHVTSVHKKEKPLNCDQCAY